MPETPEQLDADIQSHIADLKSQLRELKARERHRRFKEIVEPALGCLTYLAFAAIPIVLLVAFVKSIAWVVEVLLPILAWIGVIGLAFVPLFLILAIPRQTRAWAGLGLTLSSYSVGIGIWVWSLVIAYAMAGVLWMIIGLAFAGLGVVAVAAIASALHGEWFVFIQIAVGVVIVYFLRILGGYLIEKAEPKDDEQLPPLPPEYYDEDVTNES